jgi:hypothetical protein
MDEALIKSIIGVIFIILAINTTMILDIASRSPSQSTIADTDAGNPVPAASLKSPALPTTSVTPLPVPKASAVPTTAPPTTSLKQGNTLAATYVTIEAPQPQVTEPHTFLQTDVPRSSYEDFITIYSIRNQTLTQAFPNVSFNLVNPPLVIDYTVTPYNITDIKYVEYKQKSTYYSQNLTVTRPYEDTWFTVVVRDKDTGNIVTQDAVGKTFGMAGPSRLVVQKAGNFQFEFDGEFGYLTLTMKVEKEGNIP